MSNEPCAVEGCYVEGQHLTTCPDKTACPGCIPGLAVDGLLVCRPHHAMGVRGLKSLPAIQSDLLVALGGSYRSPQAPQSEGGQSAETPDVLNEKAFEARRDIHEWCEALVSYAVVEQGLVGRPSWDVPGMARFLLRHADWLSNQPATAGKWATTIDRVARDGRRVAARSRVSGIYLGECPKTVAKDGEQTLCGGPIRYQREPGLAASDRATTIACPWCKFEETAWWWCQRINPTSRRILMGNAAGVASLLSQKYLGQLAAQRQVINEKTVQNWATDKRITPIGCHLFSRRYLYLVADCEAQAIRAYNLTNPDLEDAS